MSILADVVQQMCRGELSLPPVARLIGFTLTAMPPGQAVIWGDADSGPFSVGVQSRRRRPAVPTFPVTTS